MRQDTKCKFKTEEGIVVLSQPPIEMVKLLVEHILQLMLHFFY